MLDADKPRVRTGAHVTPEGSGIIGSLNMSAQSHTLTRDGRAAGLAVFRFRALLSSPAELPITGAGVHVSLAAYGAWVAAIE